MKRDNTTNKKINLNQTKTVTTMWKYKNIVYKDKKEMCEALNMKRAYWRMLINRGEITKA